MVKEFVLGSIEFDKLIKEGGLAKGEMLVMSAGRKHTPSIVNILRNSGYVVHVERLLDPANDAKLQDKLLDGIHELDKAVESDERKTSCKGRNRKPKLKNHFNKPVMKTTGLLGTLLSKLNA